MKDQATLIAVCGVVGLLFAVIFYYGYTGLNLDAELIKLGVTSLMSFAGGVGSGAFVATTINKDSR
jgi:hypothetical protein